MSEERPRRVLLVEGDPVLGTVLREQLQSLGHPCVLHAEPGPAMEQARREGFTVALVDERLGDMAGLGFLKELAEVQPSTVRVVVSSGREADDIREGIRHGLLFQCLPKPWGRDELFRVVHSACEWHASRAEIATLGNLNRSLVEQVHRPGPGPAELTSPTPPSGLDTAVDLAVRLLQSHHPNLGNASLRVVALCRTIAEIAGIPAAETVDFLRAAALHDVGLVSVDRAVVRRWLRDPSKCTEEELGLVRAHPVIAESILGQEPALAGVARICRHHHEAYDGSGYPDGLKGETIPRLARLLAPVVHFCHRSGSASQVLAEMEPAVGRAFDPAAFRALVQALPRTSLPRGEREVPLADLRAGMVLGCDILNASGHPLLPKGRELRESDIQRVAAIHRVTPLAPYILVAC